MSDPPLEPVGRLPKMLAMTVWAVARLQQGQKQTSSYTSTPSPLTPFLRVPLSQWRRLSRTCLDQANSLSPRELCNCIWALALVLSPLSSSSQGYYSIDSGISSTSSSFADHTFKLKGDPRVREDLDGLLGRAVVMISTHGKEGTSKGAASSCFNGQVGSAEV